MVECQLPKLDVVGSSPIARFCNAIQTNLLGTTKRASAKYVPIRLTKKQMIDILPIIMYFVYGEGAIHASENFIASTRLNTNKAVWSFG